jgi:hypothetical protein
MAMGRPKAVLVLDAELREQLESLAKLALSSGGIGASGQEYFVERFWEDEPGNCSAAGDYMGHNSSTDLSGFAVGRSRPAANARRVFLYFFSNGYQVTSIPVFTISCVCRAYSVNGPSTYTVATHALFFPNARLTPPFNSGAN